MGDSVTLSRLRTVIGAMWWQQVLWKLPPTFDGLNFWTSEMVKYASIGLQRDFITRVVLPHFSLFAPQIFLTEVICVTLLLGVWSRFGSLLGLAMGINLLFGLYRSPSEWPWTYVFLVVIMAIFFADPPGRYFGIDVLLAKHDRGSKTWAASLLRILQ